MIRLRVGRELERQGKTAYWLADQAGLTMTAAYRLASDQMRRVDLAVLDKVCDVLGVEPGELFERKAKGGKGA
jgi:putative transcriptional regulator